MHWRFRDWNTIPEGTTLVRAALVSWMPPTVVMSPLGLTLYRRLPTAMNTPEPDTTSAAADTTPDPPNRVDAWVWNFVTML